MLLAATDHFTPVFLLEQPLSAQAVPDEFNQDGINLEELIDEIVDDDDDDDSLFPYAFLEGEVIFEASGVSGRDLSDSVVFQSSAELAFNFSFTGEDILVVGLEAGQAGDFSFVEDITFEGQLDGASDTDDSVFELGDLIYAWPLGDWLGHADSKRAALYISATGDDIEDFNPVVGDDALSDFGAENPIHELLGDFGLQLNYEIIDDLELGIGYFSEDGSDPEAGLFRGNYGAFAQLGFEPSDEFLLGLTYIYTNNDSSLETETGTLRSQIDLERPVIGNSYGIAASFAPSDRFAIGGWAGYTSARVLGLGDADVWNHNVHHPRSYASSGSALASDIADCCWKPQYLAPDYYRRCT